LVDCANPDRRIANLPLLSEAELHQILVEWNNTHADYPHDKCIHQLFENQVEQHPNAIAVTFEIDLPVRNLFEAPTVEQLARYIDTVRWAMNSVDTDEAMGQREEMEF
jgi:non-ribosomal peptide synthetase component F